MNDIQSLNKWHNYELTAEDVTNLMVAVGPALPKKGFNPASYLADNYKLARLLKQTFSRFGSMSVDLNDEGALMTWKLKSDWEKFFADYYRLGTMLTDVSVPEYSAYFDRVLYVPEGMGLDMATRSISRRMNFAMDRALMNMDNKSELIRDVRSANNGPYVIRVRNSRVADEAFFNQSAHFLIENLKLSPITLVEQLLFEMKVYIETGGPGPDGYGTVCSGSIFNDTNQEVPFVQWNQGILHIGRINFYAARSHLSHRQVLC